MIGIVTGPAGPSLSLHRWGSEPAKNRAEHPLRGRFRVPALSPTNRAAMVQGLEKEQESEGERGRNLPQLWRASPASNSDRHNDRNQVAPEGRRGIAHGGVPWREEVPFIEDFLEFRPSPACPRSPFPIQTHRRRRLPMGVLLQFFFFFPTGSRCSGPGHHIGKAQP